MDEMDFLFVKLRETLKLSVEDPEYDMWIRMRPCVYAGENGPCIGDIVADHVLGGYHGKKASGLLKVPSCWHHNQLAEQLPNMHKDVLAQAILYRLLYDQEKFLSET